MRTWLARGLCATVIAAGLTLTSGVPAGAAVPIWDVTTHTSAQYAINRNNGTRDITVGCPNGRTAINGWVNQPVEGDDLRLLIEEVRTTKSSGGSYFVRVANMTGGAGSIIITTTVRCVPTSVFSSELVTVSSANAQFPVDDSTHLAEGSVSCPSGWKAVSAGDVNMGTSSGATLLTSTPVNGMQSWHAAGYHDNVSNSMTLRVNCAPAADVSHLRFTYTTTPVSSWGTPASASCPSGLVPIIGGTWDVSANPDAISVYSRPTANGWTSTTLTLDTASIFTALFCLPAANPTLTLGGSTGYTSSPTANWTFSGSDPAAAGGYTLGFLCTFAHNGVAGPQASCSSPAQKTELPDGLHTITVVARTSDGRESAPQSRTVRVDTVDPTVAFQTEADFAFNTTAPVIAFISDDPASGVPLNECWLDSTAPAPCTSNPNTGGFHSEQLSNVSQGAHTMHVRVTDGAGNQATYDLAFKVDTVAPATTMTRPNVPFTISRSVTATWSGTDSVSGLQSFSVRSRRSPFNSGFTAFSTPITAPASTTSRVYGSLVLGSTYCWSAMATDHAGNTAATWSAERCTAIPLDDRQLTRSAGWTASTPAGWFQNTGLSTSTRGATLSMSGVVLKRVGVVAVTCPTCGKIAITVNGVEVGRINLAASTTSRKLKALPVFSLRSGKVAIKVLTSGKPVRIDALAVSRM